MRILTRQVQLWVQNHRQEHGIWMSYVIVIKFIISNSTLVAPSFNTVMPCSFNSEDFQLQGHSRFCVWCMIQIILANKGIGDHLWPSEWGNTHAKRRKQYDTTAMIFHLTEMADSWYYTRMSLCWIRILARNLVESSSFQFRVFDRVNVRWLNLNEIRYPPHA